MTGAPLGGGSRLVLVEYSLVVLDKLSWRTVMDHGRLLQFVRGLQKPLWWAIMEGWALLLAVRAKLYARKSSANDAAPLTSARTAATEVEQ
jgi:hypothetical protein